MKKNTSTVLTAEQNMRLLIPINKLVKNQVEMKNIRHQLKAVTTVKKQEKFIKRYEALKLENEQIAHQIAENI
ncbi:hypothetical protein [Bacillus cereus]|uniref:Uncharacterized protein n=1 Tax=Bacillus cereus TaxID=1396 RepID=A0A9X7B575_BACCE|nr:hypothetical protein [Bacillus cereus]PED40282.1 hypothetical protein CON26_31440 [Bacillus cereus]PFU99650.1 hypothetical protein COK98_32140 [Bacillus cereus]